MTVTQGSNQTTISSCPALPPPQHLAPVAPRRNRPRFSVGFCAKEEVPFLDSSRMCERVRESSRSDDEREEEAAPAAREQVSLEHATLDPPGRTTAPPGGGKSCLRKPGVGRAECVAQDYETTLTTMSRGSQPSHLGSHLVAPGVGRAEFVVRSGARIREGYLARLGVVLRA